MTIRQEADGSKIADIKLDSSAPFSTLGVTFPGANGNPWSQTSLVLQPQGGGYTSYLPYEGTCGGACCAELLPHRISYNLSVDGPTRRVTLNIGGSLPTMPHPNPDFCWCNNGSLGCGFSGVVP
jgi:hypothetical protein